eukprot:224832-Chlamydomonas_euryale.AAC.4
MLRTSIGLPTSGRCVQHATADAMRRCGGPPDPPPAPRFPGGVGDAGCAAAAAPAPLLAP